VAHLENIRDVALGSREFRLILFLEQNQEVEVVEDIVFLFDVVLKGDPFVIEGGSVETYKV